MDSVLRIPGVPPEGQERLLRVGQYHPTDKFRLASAHVAVFDSGRAALLNDVRDGRDGLNVDDADKQQVDDATLIAVFGPCNARPDSVAASQLDAARFAVSDYMLQALRVADDADVFATALADGDRQTLMAIFYQYGGGRAGTLLANTSGSDEVLAQLQKHAMELRRMALHLYREITIDAVEKEEKEEAVGTGVISSYPSGYPHLGDVLLTEEQMAFLDRVAPARPALPTLPEGEGR